MESTPHYTVLARRFRPQTFDDVIGQQHVAQSLKNAIAGNRVAHAYLFTGARGVGKTSMARILAKALNCPNAENGIPCNACDLCDSIAAGNDVDVLEIDGASNRGIDDIRTLRANVSVKSMRTQNKVYIIDEVHMLTREAFNALLKTLEEPPPNVKFVFCTTEPNKLPDTILSRCQRFDFGTIETQNIITRLKEIADAEGYEVEPEALELVARRAAGSMRDSQSLFDQLLAFGDEKIAAADVHRMLGTADDARLISIGTALVNRDRETALQEFGEALTEGVQLNELVDQFIHYFRDLMIVVTDADAVPLQAVAENRRADLKPQAEAWGLETIVAAMQILVEAKTKMFRTVFGRALTELALVRISLLEDLDNIAAMIGTINSGGNTAVSAPAAKRPVPKPAKAAPVSKPDAPVSQAPPPAESPAPPPQVSAPSKPQFSVKTMPLEAGSESDILSQVIDNMDVASKPHLLNASLAISGPNRVELLFSASYHLSRRACEQPEVKGRIEQILAAIAGQPVQLVVRTDDSAPAPKRELGPTPPTARPAEPAVNLEQAANDPFVQQAQEIFGGEVKDVKPLFD